MKFEAIHRKEIVVDESDLEEDLAYEDDDYWFVQEDPDENFEITKEQQVINLAYAQPISP